MKAMLHSACLKGFTTLLIATAAIAADKQTWTELPIPKDVSNLNAVNFAVGVGGSERVTKFQLKRAFPDIDFLVSLDRALGRDWLYCGGWPETSWHIADEGENELRVAAGNWCSEIKGRTMSVVIEYRVPKRQTGSHQGLGVQHVSVWEDSHMGPCKSVEKRGSNCDSPRPGD